MIDELFKDFTNKNKFFLLNLHSQKKILSHKNTNKKISHGNFIRNKNRNLTVIK